MDIDDAVDWRLIARKAQAEIERLRAAISYALLRSPWDSEPTKVQTLKKLSEALYGVVEQNAPTSKCVAEHMGRGRCVGKCLDPKDCCGTPLEQSTPDQMKECDGCGRKMPDLRCPECRNA
jgi:hypothetical protein